MCPGILPRGCNHQGEVSENADTPQLSKVTVAVVIATSEVNYGQFPAIRQFSFALASGMEDSQSVAKTVLKDVLTTICDALGNEFDRRHFLPDPNRAKLNNLS